MDQSTCQHTLDSGRPCGAPPLRGKRFCYWHHRLRQDFNLPGTHGYRPPLLESPNSVVVALNHVYLAQSRGLIDPRVVRHMQWSLRLALQSFRQLDRPPHNKMVTDPPDFGANFGVTKEIETSAGDPPPLTPENPADGKPPAHAPENRTAGIPPANAPENRSAGVSPAVARASSPAPERKHPQPVPAPERKRGVWDPEGCLSHLTAGG